MRMTVTTRSAALLVLTVALALACLGIAIGFSQGFDVLSRTSSLTSGPFSYLIGLVAIGLMVVSFVLARQRLTLNGTIVTVAVAGATVLLAAVVLVNVFSRYTDCGPGGNLVLTTTGYGIESRDGLQPISEAQYYGFLACNGAHIWLEAFAAAAVAITVQVAMMVRSGASA